MGHKNNRVDTLVTIVLIANLLFVLFGCSKPTSQANVEPATDYSPQWKQSLKPGGDEAQITLNLMLKSGADLSKPRNVDVYLYFKRREDAEAASKDLQKLAFRTDIHFIASKWSCRGTKPMVVSLEGLKRLQNDMQAIARDHAGDYDGWEAAMLPGELKGTPNK